MAACDLSIIVPAPESDPSGSADPAPGTVPAQSAAPFLAGEEAIELLELTAALDAHAIVAVTDARGRILRVNDNFCAISQYSRAELLGRDHRIINSGHHPPGFFRGLWRTIGAGRVWKGEICNRAKDGSLYWVATTIVPVPGPNGRPRRFIAIRVDVSERRRAEQRQVELLEELRYTNRELDQFAYVVSHDLKAPLRAIHSLASWLAADHADRLGPDARSQFVLLQGRVRRMEALIDGILRYSRIGREHEEIVPIDVHELVRGVCEMLAPPAGIRVRIAGTLPLVHGERTRLVQVFENLVANAIKHMGRPAGTVEIGCVEEPHWWRFHVRDDGPGIAPKYFEKIFQIFQTLKSRDDCESTGIGLAVVKKNVEVSGGQVWVESQEGAGSTFHFRLPRQRKLRIGPNP